MRDLRRRDLDFYLYDLFDLERLTADGPFAGQTRETWDSVLDTAHRIAAEKFEPIAAELDEHEPSWDGRRVHLPERLSEAIAAFNDAGFVAAAFPEAVGGLGLPYSVFQAVMATFSAANVAAVAYPLLTTAAANLIATHGSSAQRAAYVEPMLSGRFFGTMCLSETQAGSSLADIRTVAQPLSGDDYAIRGSKMWISGGEHELSENIVHLVLARLPDAPAGIRGISLFIVPRFRLDTGASNDVQLAGLNHKMGYRGTVNTVLNFGENNACVGQIVGRPNEGLAYMFHMMNEARIGVGLGANMLGYAGYRHSLAYARQRPQGRPLTDKSPESPQVPIMQHADVRRMLLAQKSLVEGGMALSFYCARLVDEMRLEEDAATKRRLLDFLTPLAKSWPSEFALEANKLAIQVLGGYGYTRDYPVERLYRDNRLNPIHEGTHGIQALDLLGRKVFGDQGQTLRDLAAVIGQDIEAATHTELAPWAEQLDAALGSWLRTTAVLGERAATGRIDTALANAHEYLCLAGHTVVAWLWLRQVMCVSDDSSEFAQGKRAAMRYFFARELPRTATWAQILTSFESSPLDLSDDGF